MYIHTFIHTQWPERQEGEGERKEGEGITTKYIIDAGI